MRIIIIVVVVVVVIPSLNHRINSTENPFLVGLFITHAAPRRLHDRRHKPIVRQFTQIISGHRAFPVYCLYRL